jgi:primosomal protein N' (replication factor Y)
MKYSIAEVALPIAVDQTFDYSIPEALRGSICVGQRVLVPFREREQLEGFVIALKEHSSFAGPLREITAIVTTKPQLSALDLALARWIADYYVAPVGIVLQTLAPGHELPKRENAVRYVKLNIPLAELLAQIEQRAKRAPQQAAILRALLGTETIRERELLARVGCSSGTPPCACARGLDRDHREATHSPRIPRSAKARHAHALAAARPRSYRERRKGQGGGLPPPRRQQQRQN